jgi:hypothetical protein
MKGLFVAVITAIALSSCNKPGVVWNDWVISLILGLSGLAGLIWSAIKYFKGDNLEKSMTQATRDRGASYKASALIIAVISALILGFGIWSYLD